MELPRKDDQVAKQNEVCEVSHSEKQQHYCAVLKEMVIASGVDDPARCCLLWIHLKLNSNAF